MTQSKLNISKAGFIGWHIVRSGMINQNNNNNNRGVLQLTSGIRAQVPTLGLGVKSEFMALFVSALDTHLMAP